MRYLPAFSSGLFLVVTLAGCSDGGTAPTGSSGATGSTGAGGTGGSATTSSGSTTTTTGEGGSATSTSTGAGGAPSDVTGTIIDTYINEAGDVTRAITAGTPVALVPSGNGFTTITGTLAPDGTFTIPDVPAGTYYFALQESGPIDTYLVTDQRKLDLGTFYEGRPDVTPITTTPTPMVLDLTGMTAWDDTDSLEIFSQGAASGSDLSFASMNPINAGDTSLTAFTVDASQFFVANQIEAAKGDTTYFTQLVNRTSGVFPYNSIGRSFKPAGLSVLDGTTTPVKGALTAVALETVTLDWKRSLFVALTAAVNPGATLSSCAIYVSGEPGGPARVTNSYPPTILYGTDPGVDDVSLKLDYGDPFPATWAANASIYADFSVPYLVPGTATMKHAHATIDVTGTITDLAAAAVKPSIAPPSALKIGGKDGYAVNTGVGLSPVLSWSAPKLGTSALYDVNLREIDAAISAGHFAGRFMVQGTSFTIPAGMLKSGSSYFVKVTAKTAGSVTTPFKVAPSGGEATTISGVFTP